MDKPEKRKDQEVPLVIYKSGERVVIGQAILKGDGSIIAQIAKDVKKEFKDLLFGDRIGDISINPVIPSIIKMGESYANLSTLPELRPKHEGS